MEQVKDILYPSDNIFDIPVLRLDMQAGNLELPFVPYGTGRKNRQVATIHFYVDDYRFTALWKNPAKILDTNASAIVEPNYSLFDTTPIARGIERIYRKRWIARYWQEHGLLIYADLNVSAKFYEYNQLGIPQGYNAFATRGYRGKLDALEMEYGIAVKISGFDCPNMIVYGGGNEIHDFCMKRSLLYVTDFMTEKGEMING